jgi:hypothetical protein
LLDFGERRFARLDDLASENVGVNDGDAALSKERCSRGFPHAHTAGET